MPSNFTLPPSNFTTSWASTAPSRPCTNAKIATASWACSGTPRAPARATPWYSSRAKCTAGWEVIAASGEHLSRLLAQHKSHVFSLIQKFNQEVEPHQPYTERDDIIVITDEAHRTQYGTLALNMHNALPEASYIGFTGTPLFKDDQITRRVFGEYISTYDFQRAVDDGATVPLY